MERLVQRLEPQAKAQVTPEFRRGDTEVDLGGLAKALPRAISANPLASVIAEALNRFGESGQTESDVWLAPRVHASLRLTRAEAADRWVWAFLAIAEFPEYVRWRWKDSSGDVVADRFIGPEYKQALARLWWGAELTRNGGSYAPTEFAFKIQDIPNTWQRLDAFHNRAAAVAAVQFLAKLRDGELATGREANRLAKAFNHQLTTVVLDELAPNPPPNSDAWDAWLMEEPDPTTTWDDLPAGPDEDSVPVESLDEVTGLLSALWQSISPASSSQS